MSDPRAILSTNIVFPDGDIPSIVAALPSENTVASASTLNLSGTTGLVVDVTGTTTINAITLAQGETRLLRFNNALTIAVSASIVNPGIKNISTVNGTYLLVLGGAAGVVSVVELVRDGIRPSKEFENIFIGTLYPLNPGLGFYIDLSAGADKQAWVKGDGSGEIIWDIGGISTLNVWNALDASGTVALTDGVLPAGVIPTPDSAGVLVDSGFQSILGAAYWQETDASDAVVSGVISGVAHDSVGQYTISFPDFGDSSFGTIATINEDLTGAFSISANQRSSTEMRLHIQKFNPGVLGVALPSFDLTDAVASVLIFRIPAT